MTSSLHSERPRPANALRLRRAVICVLCALFGAMAWSAEPAGKASTHTVTMDGVGYAPSKLTVKRGDTVVWNNKDPFPHTVTATAGAFDSHDIGAGKSWKY